MEERRLRTLDLREVRVVVDDGGHQGGLEHLLEPSPPHAGITEDALERLIQRRDPLSIFDR